MKCNLCQGQGYHEKGCSMKEIKDNYISENLELKLTAERFPGEPLLDTSITGQIQCCITWKDKEDFTEALEAVIERFRI